jgi:MerR family transcriptional regulator, redox-sensitive transcriptional activator SoxR
VADLLTIGEFAHRSGVSQSALRFYERLGLIRSTRTSGNQRRYRRTELRRVAFIRISSQVGIPLEQIKEALASLPAERTPTKADWERLSRAWRRRLDEHITLLQRLRDTLTGCIGCGCLSMRSCGLHNFGDQLAAEGTGPVRMLRGS